jgi:hypothetical protein
MDKLKKIIQAKLKEITPDYTLNSINVGDIKTKSDIKTTVTDINSETGAISWDVKYVPNIGKLVDDVNDLTKTAKEVSVKAKDDSKFLDIYEKSRKLRNTIRTHIRNQYPEEYKKIMEIDLDEVSISGGGGADASFTAGQGAGYATPAAFASKTNSKGTKNIYYYKLGYKPVPKSKPKSFDIKKLWEEDTLNEVNEFQQKRLDGLEEIEKLLNDISPLVSNAKNETIELYSGNAGSYDITQPIEMVLSYLREVKQLLIEK